MYNLLGQASPVLRDSHGRTFPYLRLSITDVCNFRCAYCLPHGYQGNARSKFLGLEEIERLAKGFAALGTTKIRLTGGEPTLRRDFTRIAKAIANIPEISQIAFTTNGYQLAGNAQKWRDAGLTHINISIDSFDPDVFKSVTGHDRLASILAGVKEAEDAEFESIKINAVLLKGINDHALKHFTEQVKDRPIDIRFIELMETGDGRDHFKKFHVSADGIKTELLQDGWTLAPRAQASGPAEIYSHPDYAGRIGVIAPYSKDFCKGCNRLRVTAKGDLRLCLFGELGIPLRPYLQSDDQIESLKRVISGQLAFKKSGHFLTDGQTGLTPHLASIGG